MRQPSPPPKGSLPQGETATLGQFPPPLQAMIRQLQLQYSALQQANTAIQAALTRVEEERNGVHAAIKANVAKVLMPLLHDLEAEVPVPHKKKVAVVRQNLEVITSPFTDKLSRSFADLTPLELHICRMLRDGLTTKEIAHIRHVSPATVSRQRERIRRKLRLTGSDANLITFLRARELDPRE